MLTDDADIAVLAEQNTLILAELKDMRHEIQELKAIIGEMRHDRPSDVEHRSVPVTGE